MPMHCSANIGPDGDTAIFFGLSRHRQDDPVGRPQPHADRRRRAWLVGHRGLQFRGRLLRQDDPAVGRGRAGNLCDHPALRHGARECGGRSRSPASSTSTTTASRRTAAAPIRSTSFRIRRPRTWGRCRSNIMMLTADAFGVLPPIARLTPEQAMYHFLSGYTAKVAGTEIGVTEPEATFSTCFGAPFMPRHPVGLRQSAQGADRQGRSRLLAGQHRLDRRQIWRRQAHADQGDARAAECRARRQPEEGRVPQGPEFRLRGAGRSCPASTPTLLDPRATWADKAEYDADGGQAGRPVRREFRAIRGPGGRGRARKPRPTGSAQPSSNRTGRPRATAAKPSRWIGPLQQGHRPMTDYHPRLFSYRRRDRAPRRRACWRARCRVPTGPMKRISRQRPICCCGGPTSTSTRTFPGSSAATTRASAA